jgi:hypothetical protein
MNIEKKKRNKEIEHEWSIYLGARGASQFIGLD